MAGLVSFYAKAAGVITALVLLALRILSRGYDGPCLTLTFVVVGVLVGPVLIEAIDQGSNLARLSDSRPLPHEDRQ